MSRDFCHQSCALASRRGDNRRGSQLMSGRETYRKRICPNRSPRHYVNSGVLSPKPPRTSCRKRCISPHYSGHPFVSWMALSRLILARAASQAQLQERMTCIADDFKRRPSSSFHRGVSVEEKKRCNAGSSPVQSLPKPTRYSQQQQHCR